MSIKTILTISLLLTAGIFGAYQKWTLPVWAWFVWGALMMIAVAAWFTVSRVVGWAVRKAVLLLPLSGRLAASAGKFAIPVAEVEASTARIEAEIAQAMRFRPVAWLAVKAFRLKAGDFLSGIVEHCRENNSDTFDERLFASWIHGKVAGTIAETAADIASGFLKITVVVLISLGLLFAMPHFS